MLTVLGRYGAYPAAGGACAGYLLQSDGVNILLDCGSGVFGRVQNYCSYLDLDCLIITHLHTDHYLDIYPMRYALQLSQFGQRKSKLPVLLPPGGVEQLTRIFDTEEGKESFCEPFSFQELNPDGITINSLKLEFTSTDHPIPAYAVKIKNNRFELVYTGDTSLSRSLEEFCRGADVLLAECTLRNQDEDRAATVGHLTAGQAGALAKGANIKKLMLTHFWPEFSLEQYAWEAEEAYGQKPIVVEEMKTYHL